MNRISETINQLRSAWNGVGHIPKWISTLFAIVMLGVLGFLFSTSDDWKVRMTVTIDTPEGIRTGSSVWRIHRHSEPSFFPAQGGVFDRVDKGEAVVIDLGKRGVVFALLRGADWIVDYSHIVALKAFPDRGETPLGTEFELSPHQYPMFVIFSDLKDPKTVRLVYSERYFNKAYSSTASVQGFTIDDGFENAFGVGVKIKAIKLEMTDDAVSLNLDKLLPWISQIHGLNLAGTHSTFTPIYTQLYADDFQRGNQ